MNGISLIAYFFLADALRRIYKSYKEHTSLMSNEKVMALHLVLLIFYFVSILCKTFSIQKWITNPTNENYSASVFFYTLSVWMEFFD